MRGLGKCLRGRAPASALELKGEVAVGFVPDLGRLRSERTLQCNRRQRLVFDLKPLGGVLRLRRRLRDHDGDAVTDMPHLAVRENRLQGPVVAASFRQGRIREAWQPAEMLALGVLAREHGEDAARRLSRKFVDAHDARMRMRRSQDVGVGQLRHRHVVHVTSPAGEKTRVFHARHRGADAGVHPMRRAGTR